MKYLFLMLLALPASAQRITSQLEIYDIRTNKRAIVHTDTLRFEAPNWMPNGQSLLINQQGKLYSVDIRTGKKIVINTDLANRCNNDHGISPDGKTIVISHNDPQASRSNNSRIFTVPIGGGKPTLITDKYPSYWHGWSPDGQTLAYTAEREQPDGSRDFDIYTIPANGSTRTETRLTDAKGLDDGPDYSPDGRYIYFNSYRTGVMQLWRINVDGSNPRQLTNDAYSNWFPHPSPNGKWIVFISYLQDQGSAHPADKEVMLRLMDVKTGKIRELCRFRGGQGTINVPSWSADSNRFAFVSYP